MARYVKNHWAKKSNKGAKTFGKVLGAGLKIGAAGYKALDKYEKKNRKAVIDTGAQEDIPKASLVTMLIGFLISIIYLFFVDSFFEGFTSFVIINAISMIISVILSFFFKD